MAESRLGFLFASTANMILCADLDPSVSFNTPMLQVLSDWFLEVKALARKITQVVIQHLLRLSVSYTRFVLLLLEGFSPREDPGTSGSSATIKMFVRQVSLLRTAFN